MEKGGHPGQYPPHIITVTASLFASVVVSLLHKRPRISQLMDKHIALGPDHPTVLGDGGITDFRILGEPGDPVQDAIRSEAHGRQRHMVNRLFVVQDPDHPLVERL